MPPSQNGTLRQARFHPYNPDAGKDTQVSETIGGTSQPQDGEIERAVAMRTYKLQAAQIDLLKTTRTVPIPGRPRAKFQFFKETDVQTLAALISRSGNTGTQTKQPAKRSAGRAPSPAAGQGPDAGVTDTGAPPKRTKQTARKGSGQLALPAPARIPNLLSVQPPVPTARGAERTKQTARKTAGQSAAATRVSGPSAELALVDSTGGPETLRKRTKQTARKTTARAVSPMRAPVASFQQDSAASGSDTGVLGKRTKQTARKSSGQRPPRTTLGAGAPRGRTKQTARKTTGRPTTQVPAATSSSYDAYNDDGYIDYNDYESIGASDSMDVDDDSWGIQGQIAYLRLNN
ncbi:hypothetical protein NM688_g1625 [Phlebia brevispora]|uniref:Uncharacterized protein n=1 Tax=Phlebia brevispora TaxID=194682 RepID=A0ACC1TB82_9APHY|nr:hypothetical protein NM688_g1625 [Phlebia brevispora]